MTPGIPPLRIIPVAVLALLTGPDLCAADLVHWGEGADIVTAQRVLSGSSGVALSPVFRNSPATSDYYAGDPDPPDRSALFIATAFTGSEEAAARADVRIGNDHSPTGTPFDTILFSIDAGAAVPQAAGGLVLWDKQDGFLNGFDTVAVDFDRLAFSLTGNSNTQPVSGGAQTRIVVRNGSAAYYVSNNMGVYPTGANGWGTFTDADITTWHAFDPTIDISVIGEAVPAVLDDITAIGFLYLVDDTGARRYFNTHTREFLVTVLPNAANLPPEALDDFINGFSGQTTRIPVLDNDTDPDSDPIHIQSVADPSAGSVQIDGREILYSAPAGFTGSVSFSYTVADVYGSIDTATVNVSVSPAPPKYLHTIHASVATASFSWTLESTMESLVSGTFVDGQPWVVVPPGGLTLVAAVPARATRSGEGNWVEDREFNEIAADINITVVNPPVGDYYENVGAANPRLAFERAAFGWDSRGAIRYGTGRRYDPELGWDGLTPVELVPGDIVTTPKSFVSMAHPDGGAHETVLEAVAVLTVLAAAPPADAFRPGVIRSGARRADPEFIQYSDIITEIDDFLIDLPATNLFGEPVDFDTAGIPDEFSAARLTSLMPGPAIMNIGFNDSQGTHGYLNNSGATYSADISRLMGDLAVGALAGWLTPQQRRTCRIRFLQRAIDAYEALKAGLCLSHDGGMMTAYGLRLALAGRMLDHPGMQEMDTTVHGLPSWYFLSDYAQVFYLGDPFAPGLDGPSLDSPRFVAWNTPAASLRLVDVPVAAAGDGFVEIPTAFTWPFYRPVRELPNIKFRVASGAGAGARIYTVTGVENYVSPTPELADESPEVSGGKLLIKPDWEAGVPGSGSLLEFFPAVRAESNRWVFKSWGIYRNNRFVTLNRDSFSLSPMTDYGGVNIGGSLSLLIALYALEAEAHYSGGMDKWLIQAGGIPGYGEFIFNYNRSRQAGDPVVRPGLMERSLLGGLWKEQVLERAGSGFAFTGEGLAALPVATPGLPGDSVGNGLEDSWEIENFGYLGVPPLEDADSDGTSNELEFLAGTDPLDPASAFRPLVVRAGDALLVRFPTVAGRHYRIKGSADLRQWDLLDTLTGDGSMAEWLPSLDDRFLRIEIIH